MAITTVSSTTQKLPKSVKQTIAGTFSTTDTSGTMSTTLKMIRKAVFTPLPSAVLGAGEILFIVPSAVAADGTVVVPSNQTIRISRIGTPTSGLKFTVELEGN